MNNSIKITISDPWDLYKVNGPYLFGTIANHCYKPKNILIKLDKPITYNNGKGMYFTVSARHAGDNVLSIMKGDTVFCNIFGTSANFAKIDINDNDKEHISGDDWCNVQIIGTVQLVNCETSK